MTTSKTAWVRSPVEATGQDQLGVRFFSETLYQRLMPGITNVSSRARYYSFYPWFIWAVEKRSEDLHDLPLRKLIRRADCLLTLVGLYHSKNLESQNAGVHDGLIGARKLSRVLNAIVDRGQTARLSTYATEEETAERYFKNKHGGLGQYYFGPLRDLGILAYGENSEILYTQDRGRAIAEAVESFVASDAFFAAIKSDLVSIQTLESLQTFCLCRLSESPFEREILIDVFLSRKETFQSPNAVNRKETIALILDFIDRSSTGAFEIGPTQKGVQDFLASTYTKAFPSEPIWEPTTDISNESRDLWGYYYSSELLSFAIQTLFWAGMTALTESRGTVLWNSRDYGIWFTETFASSLAVFPTGNFFETVAEYVMEIPPLTDRQSEKHEISIVRTMERILASRLPAEKRADLVTHSLRLLLTLAARWTNADDFLPPPQFQSNQLIEYPVNIKNFVDHCGYQWKDLAIDKWVIWLVSKWNLETHLMVAMRKLRFETLDTFKIYPSDRGLQVRESVGNKSISEILLPGFTNPRLTATVQILLDIGILILEHGNLKLSVNGKSILEELTLG